MSGTPLDPETQWMLHFQAGDEQAFVEIVKRFEKPLINFAYGYLGDVAWAEDAAQDVFLEIYKRARSYRPTGKFSTWLFTIAAHRCLNLKRRPRRLDEIVDQSDPNQPSPADQAEVREQDRRIRAALLKLPEKQRVALLLAKYDEMALEDVAAALAVSEGAVKQLVHRAKENLRKLLAGI